MRPLSARNPRVQRLTQLVKRHEERAEQRALVVEGPVLVAAALDAGRSVLDVYIDEAALTRPAVAELLPRLLHGPEPWVLPAGTLDRIGDVVTSQGVVAVVEAQPSPWPESLRVPFVVVLAGLQIPGNVGTLLRAAAAAGAGAVVCAGGADPTSPKVVRASAGAVFGIDVVSSPEPGVAIARLRSGGYRCVGAVVRGGSSYREMRVDAPLALVLGSEGNGLDPAVLDALDEQVSIPMAGPTESLNVAMAGTLLCFEVLRRGQSS